MNDALNELSRGLRLRPLYALLAFFGLLMVMLALGLVALLT